MRGQIAGEGGRQQRVLAPGAALEGVDDAARAHDGDAVADQHQFAQVARHDDEALALARLFGQHLINIKLGADIDAARGLVEQHHGAVAVQPAGDHHFLLVAA